MIYIIANLFLLLLVYVFVAVALSYVLSLAKVFNPDDSAFFALLWPLWPVAVVLAAIVMLGAIIVILVNEVAKVAARWSY